MIILLGFPKSGTTSFQSLFTQCGYKSAHWFYNGEYIGKLIDNNIKSNKKMLHGINVDAITQMDVCLNHDLSFWHQVTNFKDLYYQYPDAIYILNMRNTEKLYKSFKNWGEYDKRIINYSPQFHLNDNNLQDFFNKHYHNVLTFFNNQPSSKFIAFDIENDNIEKLRKYIKIPLNIKSLPHKNKNKNSI